MDVDDDSPEKKISRIRKDLLTGSSPEDHPTSWWAPNVNLRGDGNIVGNGNVVFMVSPWWNERPKVVVQTGVGVIDAAQKARINELIKDWVSAWAHVRTSRAEIAALRSAFNKAMHVNSYAEIKQEDFEKAVAWLRRQIAIIGSMASAPVNDPKWRTKRYRAINARAKEAPNGEAKYRQFAFTRFGTTSLKDLTDDQLDAVYYYVFGWPKIME